MISFIVPGDPQGKGRPRVGRVAGHARMFTPPKTAAYEQQIAFAGRQAMRGRAPLTGPVALRMTVIFAVPKSSTKRFREAALSGVEHPTKKPDIDNTVKAVADACNGVLWVDDAQIVDLAVSKVYGESPGVLVRVWAAGPGAAGD